MSKQSQKQSLDKEIGQQKEQQQSHNDQQSFPEYYLAMNDFLDALQAFPYDIIRQFTLLKEIDAKCVNSQPEINKLVDDYLDESNKSKEEAHNENISNYEASKKRKLELLNSMKELLLNSLPCYEEKLAIANLAIDLVYKNMDRINNDLEVIINKEIPKIVKYGPKNHPAIKQDKNDVASNSSKSVQSQRSESRRQAIAAKRFDSETPQSNQQAGLNVKSTRESTPTTRTGGPAKRKYSEKTRNNDKGNDVSKHQYSKEKAHNQKEKGASSKGNNTSNQSTTLVTVAPTSKRQKVDSKTDDSKKVKHAEEETNDVYCFCRQVSFGEMIGCDNDNCKIQWFHMQCVGLDSPPKGTWYCDDCKKQFNLK